MKKVYIEEEVKKIKPHKCIYSFAFMWHDLKFIVFCIKCLKTKVVNPKSKEI